MAFGFLPSVVLVILVMVAYIVIAAWILWKALEYYRADPFRLFLYAGVVAAVPFALFAAFRA